jgi:hypothetical protein
MKPMNCCLFTWALLCLVGCSGGPAVLPVHDDPLTGVWLAADSRAGTGHAHPYTITPDAMRTVLSGIQVEERDTITGTGLLGSRHGRPAFTPPEIDRIAPHLIEALRKASPKDIATFYMIVGDDNRKRAVTSGGLFVDEQRRLHFMLANWRSVPSGGQDYTMAMELDSRDEPLLPISPYRFRVGFHPPEAWIKNGEESRAPRFRAYKSAYSDPAKLVVVDLNRLPVSSP